jgi:hypothetical protein
LRVNVAVEGESDEGAAEAVIVCAGHELGTLTNRRGKTRLDPQIAGYVRASVFEPWVVFRDSDSECPVALRNRLLAGLAPNESKFALRVAHSMTEAWLLADTDGFAEYFSISRAILPNDPDGLLHAKHEVLRLCARSRSRQVRHDMVRGPDEPGQLYVTRINEFARTKWNVEVAAESSRSLARALDAVRRLG